MQQRFIGEQEQLLDAYRLAVSIWNSGFRPSCIAGLWPGGASAGICVHECLRHLGVEADHAPLGVVRTAEEGAGRANAPVVRVRGLQSLAARLRRDDRLLLVDDIWATGETVRGVLSRIAAAAAAEMPLDVRVATVWFRPRSGGDGNAPDFFLRRCVERLVMPWELAGLPPEQRAVHRPWLQSLLGSGTGVVVDGR